MMSKHDIYFNTTQAGLILGVSGDHVRRLILDGKLRAHKVGKMWLIERNALKAVQKHRLKKKG